MQTSFQLESHEDFARSHALDVKVYVYSVDDINSDPVVVGLISEWDTYRKIVIVNDYPYEQTKFVFLTKGD